MKIRIGPFLWRCWCRCQAWWEILCLTFSALCLPLLDCSIVAWQSMANAAVVDNVVLFLLGPCFLNKSSAGSISGFSSWRVQGNNLRLGWAGGRVVPDLFSFNTLLGKSPWRFSSLCLQQLQEVQISDGFFHIEDVAAGGTSYHCVLLGSYL